MPPLIPYNSDRSDDPAIDAVAVTPSDSVDLIDGVRGLWVGGAGAVAVQLPGFSGQSGATVTFSGVAAGTLLPVRARKVLATGTTATLILGLR